MTRKAFPNVGHPEMKKHGRFKSEQFERESDVGHQFHFVSLATKLQQQNWEGNFECQGYAAKLTHAQTDMRTHASAGGSELADWRMCGPAWLAGARLFLSNAPGGQCQKSVAGRAAVVALPAELLAGDTKFLFKFLFGNISDKQIL